LMYWQSEVDGCDKIPNGVTHVVFGFLQVGDGTSQLDITFQGNDNTTKSCITHLRERCIYVMGSIGGANNKENMATITNPKKFAKSVMKAIQEFDLDGVDVDDEAVGSLYDATRAIKYMKATRNELKKDPQHHFILTWDALPKEIDPTTCNADFNRCWNDGLVPLVDWINVLSYNFEQNPRFAASIYQGAIAELFPKWIKAVGGDQKKLNLGVCVDRKEGGGCAWGPGPGIEISAEWAEFSKNGAGMLIYAGSSDIKDNFKLTMAIVNAQNSISND